MVTRTDKLFEKFSLSHHGTMALPVTVYETVDGRITYSVYKKLVKPVTSFESEGICPFGGDGILRLRQIAEPLMEKHGYTMTEAPELLLEYKATAPLSKDTVSTVILKSCAEIGAYPADTTLWNLEVDDGDTADVICAVIVNGRIAAYACVNDMCDEDGYEITVECAPAYRRRGFASSCAVGITNYLIGTVKASAVHYKCRSANEASKKTAEKAGFTYVGRSLSFVFER